LPPTSKSIAISSIDAMTIETGGTGAGEGR